MAGEVTLGDDVLRDGSWSYQSLTGSQTRSRGTGHVWGPEAPCGPAPRASRKMSPTLGGQRVSPYLHHPDSSIHGTTAARAICKRPLQGPWAPFSRRAEDRDTSWATVRLQRKLEGGLSH